MLKLLVIKPNEGLQVIEPNQRFQLTPESMQVGGSGPPGSVGATWQYTLPHVTVNSSKMGQCWHDATYWESVFTAG
jgi:hypothetical protein